MIDEKILEDAVDIILERILTPVIYLYCDEALEFICFTDTNTRDDDFMDTQAALFLNLGITAEVLDIRTFDEADRVEITKNGQLLYAENEAVQSMFEMAMLADQARILADKKTSITRKTETGTYFAC